MDNRYDFAFYSSFQFIVHFAICSLCLLKVASPDDHEVILGLQKDLYFKPLKDIYHFYRISKQQVNMRCWQLGIF